MKLLSTLVFFITCSFTAFSQTPFWEPINGPQGLNARWMYTSPDTAIYVWEYNQRKTLRSLDHGVHWTEIQGPEAGSPILGFQVGQTGALFARDASSNYFRSTDRGDTWSLFEIDFFGLFAEGPDSALYVMQERLIQKTYDGITWDTLYQAQHSAPAFFNFGFLPDGALVASTMEGCDLSNGDYFAISHDLGQTWQTMPGAAFPSQMVPLGNGEYLYKAEDIFFCYGWAKTSAAMIIPMPVHPPDYSSLTSAAVVGLPNGTIMYSLPDTSFISFDAGQTWETHDGNVMATVLPYPEPKTGDLMRGYGFGIRRSSDLGKTWRYSGYGDLQAWTFGLTFGAPNHVYGLSSSGFWYSEDDGDNWNLTSMDTLISDFDVDVYNMSQGPNGELYVIRVEQLLRSTDNGVSFEELTVPPTAGRHYRVATHPVSGEIFLTGDSVLLASTDMGISWEIRNNAISFGTDPIKFHPDGSLYAITGGQVKHSTDNGVNWATVLAPGQFETLRRLEIGNDGKLVACTDFKCYFSTDNGANWTASNVPGGMQDVAINSAGVVYTASNSTPKVYFTSNNGLNWTALPPVSTTPNIYLILDIAFDAKNRLWVSIDGDGLLRSAASTVSAPEPVDQAAGFLLYPNPINEGFWIDRTDWAVTSPVTVRVLDVLGREVYRRKTIESSLFVQTGGWAQGVYWVRLEAGTGKVVTKKVIKGW